MVLTYGMSARVGVVQHAGEISRYAWPCSACLNCCTRAPAEKDLEKLSPETRKLIDDEVKAIVEVSLISVLQPRRSCLLSV